MWKLERDKPSDGGESKYHLSRMTIRHERMALEVNHHQTFMALHSPKIRSNASENVLNTPELLSHICAFSQPSELVRLCGVSRKAFYSTVPLIWRNVDGAHNLFALLPNALISKPNYQKGRYFRRVVSKYL